MSRKQRITSFQYLALIGLVLLISPSVLAQTPPSVPVGPPRIIGLPLEAVEHIPGVVPLFTQPDASASCLPWPPPMEGA